MKEALPNLVRPSSTNLDISVVSHPTFIQQPPSSYLSQIVNPNVCNNSFSCPTDKYVTETLSLFRPLVLCHSQSQF